ncbi:MAG TPA: alpha/beta hydrolase [Steroidobacteraceae bacterium]|nr:alpha/beta hydrolase [Steroidobacteraceae bacterium]
MPLDPRVKRFLDVLAAGNPPNALEVTVEQRRLGLAELMRLAGPAAPVGGIENRTLPGPGGRTLAVRIYTPQSATPQSSTPQGPETELSAGLVYFHGGGLVAGSVETHDSIARALAHFGGCRVVSVEYRLAPEHPFPAALDDALAAVTHIGANAAHFRIDGARLGICGDSAGATLAAATAQAIARIGGPRLALQVLICPILDYSRRTESRRDLASGYLVDQATLDHDLLHYAPPGTDPADPRISPLRAADIAGLPRTLIHTAEFDPLRDEGRDYFERLARARCEVSYTCHPGMIHLFYGLGAVIPYARTAFEQIGGEIRAALA